MGESRVWFVVEKVLITLLLRTCDLLREEVGCVDGVIFWVAWSELEDKIE